MSSVAVSGQEIRTGPRSAKGVDTRARLVDAAKGVFERDGFMDARVSDIAEAASLASGSVYHYFGSKEQIFLEVAVAQERRLSAPHDELVDSPVDHSPWERIRGAIRLYLERYRAEAKLMGVVEQVSRYDEHVNAARMATLRAFVDKAERAVEELQREGIGDPRIRPAIAADALGAMIGRLAELWLVEGYREHDFDDAVTQLSLLCGNALGIASDR